MPINKYTIFGERASGTNYLQNLIDLNFDAKLTWEFGFKHFFGHNNLENSDDTLFICIVRDPHEWLNSFWRNPWHLSPLCKSNINNFLTSEISSYNNINSGLKDGTEILEDRHIFTKERYKNIFELRHTKLKYMIEDLIMLVNHYIFIKHEDLLYNFENTMHKIRSTGLQQKQNIKFPLNTLRYKNNGGMIYKKNKNYLISKKRIYDDKNLNPKYEKICGYL